MKIRLNFSGIEPVVSAIFLLTISPFFFLNCTEREEGGDVKIVAHRGAMADRPENTMAAFQRAYELGADIIEIDLRTSSDGPPVYSA